MLVLIDSKCINIIAFKTQLVYIFYFCVVKKYLQCTSNGNEFDSHDFFTKFITCIN